MNTTNWKRLLRSLLVAIAAFAPCAVRADLFEWNPQSGDDFGTDGNWWHNGTFSGVPGVQDLAVDNVNNASNTTLRITGDQAVDPLRISDGKAVVQTGGTLVIANTGVVWDRGLWIGEFGTNNSYTLNGGTIVIDDDWDPLILGKTNGAAGTLNLQSGSITLANANPDVNANEVFIGADGAGTWNQGGGSFQGRVVTLAKWAPVSSTGTVNLDGGTFAASQVRKGAGTSAYFNFNGGTLRALASNPSFFQGLDRANVRDGGATIDTNGFDVTVAQALAHSDIGGDNTMDGGLVKTGAGVLTVTANHSFTGDTVVDAGTLAVGAGGSFYDNGNNAGTLVVNNGGTLRFDRTDTFGIANTLSPVVLEVNAGGNVLSNGQLNSIHHVVLAGGTLTANGGLGPDYGAYGLNGTVAANGAVTSTIADGGGEVNYARIGREGTTESTTFDVTDAAGVLAVDIPLRDNFGATSGLAKTGGGRLALNAASSYAGPTLVSAGTLVVNGSLAAATTTTVGLEGALAGTGTLNGAAIVDGTLAPGTSAGTLAINAPLVLGSASTLEFELDGGNQTVGGSVNDLVAGVTSLTLDGTLDVIDLDPGRFAGATSGTWRLIEFSGGLTDNGLALGSLPVLPAGYQFQVEVDQAGPTHYVNLVVIPEPGAALLVAVALAGLARLHVRRRR